MHEGATLQARYPQYGACIAAQQSHLSRIWCGSETFMPKLRAWDWRKCFGGEFWPFSSNHPSAIMKAERLSNRKCLQRALSNVMLSSRSARSSLKLRERYGKRILPMSTASPLLALPPELRTRVYDFYFFDNPTEAPPSSSKSPLALSLICRQLHYETRTLALQATTFRASRWHIAELKAKAERLLPICRLAIRRFELTIGIAEFLIQPQSLDGLMFADAGLASLEQLCIRFVGQPQPYSREGYIASNLEVVLLKTVAKRRNDQLRKIRIVHSGLLRLQLIEQICSGIRRRLGLGCTRDSWETTPKLEGGLFELLHNEKNDSHGRRIQIIFGSTVQEAENQCKSQQALLKAHSGIRP
ncbi:hypothetical protein CC78DRAFT_578805 [Lojkania enalia]|uniref:F-box domain-containing protein n=1 Tax=Lojkania enalia TaxID=147567 RepID=A0A9P4KD17_9PLEO|nr:hypothetical protein CC78DRAFT_578805 [Didymosphaeria enalia]